MNLTWCVGLTALLAIVFIVGFWKSAGINPRSAYVDTTHVQTRENARRIVSEGIINTSASHDKREEFRNQLKVLTLTLSVTLLGFSFSRGKLDNMTPVLIVILLFCCFMFLMDSMLWDLSFRQINYNARLTETLLKLDSPGFDSLQVRSQEKMTLEAIQTVYAGIDTSSDWEHKLLVSSFNKGRFDFIWYVLPALISLGAIIWSHYKKM